MDCIQVLRCRIEQDALVVGQLVDVVDRIAVGWQRLHTQQAAVQVDVFAEQKRKGRAAYAAVKTGVDDALRERQQVAPLVFAMQRQTFVKDEIPQVLKD